ncbi:nuclear transport factor 2 family protein [Tepidimonas sp.]|uniref:nuclear transport factor 2 family protein n=1 Tax=Tepidimonas sp. TaxID=2002775 RepID=UPI002FE22E02
MSSPAPVLPPCPDSPVQRVAQFYATLTPATLAQLDTLYTPDAYFKDPFNEVRGTEAIARIFRHMYAQVLDPRFAVHDCVQGDAQAFLTWTFHFRWHGAQRAHCIRGCTHLRFAPDGRVTWHRDYWDAAEELYAHLPLLGALMRWLRRRVQAEPTAGP